MNLYVALLAYNREAYLRATFQALMSCAGAENVNLRVFVDGPRNGSDEPKIAAVVTYFEETRLLARFKTFEVFASPANLGAWKGKLSAFKDCFEDGADMVLLVEDDVVLRRDALTFLHDIFDFASRQQKLITIGLYSNALQFAPGLPFKKSKQFILANRSSLSAWGARKWPFPWGLALLRKSFEKFVAKSWTGNDQDMGRILLREDGRDLFPIITRSYHVGETSSISGESISIAGFPDFLQPVETASFSIGNSNILSAEERANVYARELRNDLGINHLLFQMIAEKGVDLSMYECFAAKYPFIRMKVTYVDTMRPKAEVIENLDFIASRIYASIFILYFRRPEYEAYLQASLQTVAGVKVFNRIQDEEEILNALRK